MKAFRLVLPGVVMFLLISLACSALQPTAAPATQVVTVPIVVTTATPLPATPTAAPSPTEQTLPQSNSRIAYTRFVEGEGIFIYTVDADGQNDVRLTGDDCLSLWPSWSSDGSLISYYCVGSDDKARLWVMNQDGTDARFVAELPDLLAVKWSPDNRYLLYHAPQPDGNELDVYLLDISNGEISNLTENSPVWDAFPDWSPDGSMIVLTSDRAPQGKALDDVWTMQADGSDQVNLTDNGDDWEDYHPAWSPDGKSIAFFRGGSLFNENAEGGPAGIWVMDPDGKNQRLVTAVETFRASGPPVWSPDGRYLAYILGEKDAEDVWVVPSAGGDPVKLSDLPGEKSDISWSPDSSALIFTNDDNTADTLLIYLALPDGSDTHELFPDGRYGFGDWGP